MDKLYDIRTGMRSVQFCCTMLEALIKTSAAVISHDAVAIHTVHTRPAVQRSREQEQIDRPIHQFIIGTTDQDIMLFLRSNVSSNGSSTLIFSPICTVTVLVSAIPIDRAAR